MSNMGYFIDVERFVQWTYGNEDLFGSEENAVLGVNTVKKWRRYETLPVDKSLEIVNAKLRKDEVPFEKINIAEMMICINNAKDHNRGKNSKLSSITSTGKKVMTLLLLGRIFDGNSVDGFLVASKRKHMDVFDYLAKFSKRPKQNGEFFYLPGRTISFEQLCDLSKDYKNGITSRGIFGGLVCLEQIGLVECVGENLYKLSFRGCKDFLEKNK